MSFSGLLKSKSGPSPSGSSSAPLSELFGGLSELNASKDKLPSLISHLRSLPCMDKSTMSGRCARETDRMEQFMNSELGLVNNDDWIVQGVMAFDLHKPIDSQSIDTVLRFATNKKSTESFCFTVAEAKEWQESFRVYAASDIYSPSEEGKSLLQKSLRGKSEAGLEAWKMKFVTRMSRNPIFCEFDGETINRLPAKDDAASRIWLASVSGVDFAGRVHDTMDTTHYMSNWREVYHLTKHGLPYVHGHRDFVPTGVRPILNRDLLFQDLVKMARVRLYAAQAEGISVIVETGIGLGVFSGDNLGIGDEVRQLSAAALRQVLEQEAHKLSNIQLVVAALPIFKRGGVLDNYHFFVQGFKGYTGRIAVLIADQDMHKLARHTAEFGYVVSELNPADSHGVVGEYWQNRGPGTEEKLALTTAALITQHHLVNPHVLDTKNYKLIDVSGSASVSVSEAASVSGSASVSAGAASS